jgi:D-alanyl-D-alanine dipeptidase
MPKAAQASQAKVLTDIPNIGVSIAQDLRGLGIATPADVAAMDPLAVFDALRGPMGQRHDPCVLDTFMAAKAFMNGGPRQPWWHFTAERKALLNTKK